MLVIILQYKNIFFNLFIKYFNNNFRNNEQDYNNIPNGEELEIHENKNNVKGKIINLLLLL